MNILHVRHATSILFYAGLRILIDPVLAEKEAFPPIPLTPNRRRNPLVSLSTDLNTLLEVDLILCTHIHNDHFDTKAMELLDKDLDLICQCDDANKLSLEGFRHVIPVKKTILYKSITIIRVQALHGTGATGQAMAPASGYILQSETEPTVYITGDTVFHPSIKRNILHYQPNVLIINAGSPKLLNSSHIVMNIMDIEKTLQVNPKLKFVIVHLDTFNHCIETREHIREYFSTNRLKVMGVNHFYVPDDNEFLVENCFKENTD